MTTSVSLWYDSVYGSEVNDFAQARLINRVTQRRFLEPNGQYDSQLKFRLGERVKFSDYYIFVIVDREMNLDDFNYANNQLDSPKLVRIKPLPLPNLEPSRILVNDLAKAGQRLTIQWNVVNIGEGAVKATDKWTDFVEVFLVSNFSLFRSISRANVQVENRPLAPNEAYLMRTEITLPIQYFGEANIELLVNRYDTLYESSMRDNSMSTFFTILPPDTPDLSLIAFNVSHDTILTGQVLTVMYSVENEGNANLEGQTWTDELKIVNKSNRNQVIVSQNFRNLSKYNISKRHKTLFIYIKYNMNPLRTFRLYSVGNGT